MLLIAPVILAEAELPINVMADSDEKTVGFVIYYLSPQFLTRTRMTPERLSRDTFRLEDKGLPIEGIHAFIKEVRSTEHEFTGERRSSHDFRLCI